MRPSRPWAHREGMDLISIALAVATFTAMLAAIEFLERV
jgi:hypothetical protein